MGRLAGLDQDLALSLRSPRSAGCLCEKLKGPLTCPVAWNIQRQVCHQDPDQRHIREIMSLHDHLCADHDIRLMGGKRGKYLQLSILAGGGILVHPQHPGVGKQQLHFPLHLLRTDLERPQKRTGTFRAGLRHGRLIAAVMAQQAPSPVKSQRHITVGTFQHMTAGSAGNEPRIASAVQKQHRLFTARESLPQSCLQFFTEDRTVAGGKFIPHIDDLHMGKCCCLCTPGQADLCDQSPGGCIGSLQRRSCRPQHNAGAFHLRALHGYIPGMIPGRLLTLVTLFVFLVDHNDPEVRKRCEQGRPRTDHHIQISLTRPVELVLFLTCAHLRMDHGHPAAEPVVETHQRLVSERDLRD